MGSAPAVPREPAVSQQFDSIAVQYDATREPMDPATERRLIDVLRAQGLTSILEVGVGTGRISAPLAAAGFQMTGVDGSLAMLGRARARADLALVRGDAYHLPFADGSVDGALFVHVLHLLDDPKAGLTEALRVARSGAAALVRPRSREPAGAPVPEGLEPRRIVARELAKAGYPGREMGGGPPVKERRLLEQYPPARLEILQDREVTEPLADSLRLCERGASRHTLDIPPEILARAVATAREEVGDRTRTYRSIEALATWTEVPGA